jgi:AmiR/NasT family two-component response regulator
MHPYRKAQLARPLHVLVVEHEPAELSKACARLLAEGCELSTSRVAFGLFERVEQLQPDMILVDVLMSNLESAELGRLVGRGGTAEPSVVIHTKVLRPLLRRVLDVSAILGVITRTDNDAEFSRMFREATRRLRSRSISTDVALGSAISGTRAIFHGDAEVALEQRTLKQG